MEICSMTPKSTVNIARRRYTGRATCEACNTCVEPCGAACEHYSGGVAATTWPCQTFPAAQLARRYSESDLRNAKIAWATFERVEAHDAASRIRLSGTGWNPATSTCKTPWYRFSGSPEHTAYRRGRELHIELCGGLSWRPQRTLGISATPVTDVRPGCCAAE
jgi:hypothetical protein